MKRLVTPNKHSEEIKNRYRYRYRNRNRRVIHSLGNDIYVSLKSKFIICTQELESEREVIYPPPSPPPPPSPEKDVDIPSEEERLAKTPPENSTSPVFGDGTKDRK